ncbi:MAG TPA: hypothetical protein VNO22_11570 [Planctomycetota bacterium]|nr:hypothetical protein [Planctomycetota bacterium]
MSLRLVRCPYCGKRFNVGGVAAGTRLRCAGCTAVLTVPRAGDSPGPRSGWSLALQIVTGAAAGLAAAWMIAALLRPEPEPLPAPPRLPERTAEKAPRVPDLPAVPEQVASYQDDPYGRAVRRLQQEFGSRFFYHKAKPYLIALEASPRYHATMVMEDYAQRMEVLHSAFQREFGRTLNLPEVEPALVVLIFNSRESFDRYFLERDRKRMSDSIKGIYEYDRERRRVVVYHDYNVPYDVLFHEGVHQLVHHHTLRETEGRRVFGTYWLQEGLGTYFEGLRRGEQGGFFDPAGGRDRLPTLKQALPPRGGGKGDFIPLNVLVGLTVDHFWQWFEEGMLAEPEQTTQKARLYYAQSWALVHFLRHRGAAHGTVLDEYLRREIAGRGGKEVFEDLVRHHLKMELPELEEEFIAYIQGLR